MNTRAWCVVSVAWAALLLASVAQAQSLERRVAAAPDGSVRFSFAARPGVYGNGRNMIGWDCDKGSCRSRQVDGNWDSGDWDMPCDSGPVRVALTKRGSNITDLRVYVGGSWRTGATATDLGTVGVKEAANYLLSLAARDESRAAEQAILPAVLADSVTIWPDLLRIAKTEAVSRKVRRSAVFWLGQAAGEAVTGDLAGLAEDAGLDREVRESAVFALSQQPHETGVPALIRIARSNRDPEVRRKAIFWLGQSDDPRALALFEEILLK